jgi:hypothetical protein
VIRLILISLLTSILTGCASLGVLFTHVVEPYTENFHNTPIGSKQCILRDHTIQVNSVSAEWVTEYFADALKEAGIEKFYYAEMRTFSVLFGLYKRKTIIVHGD